MNHPHPTLARRLAAILSLLALTAFTTHAADAPAAAAPAPPAAVTANATVAGGNVTTGNSTAAAKVNTAIVPTPKAGGWVQTHQRFVDLAKKGDIDILFLGDSITDFWRNRGKEVWDKNYGSLKAANFGISADKTENVLWRLANGEGEGFKPKVIVLLIGTNNVGLVDRTKPDTSPLRNTTEEAIEGVTAVVKDLRKRFPDAKILLQAIFPRGDDLKGNAQIPDVNKAIAKLDDQKNVFFIDFGKKFLGTDGSIAVELFPDKLHPNAKGYEIWAESIKEPLDKLMK